MFRKPVTSLRARVRRALLLTFALAAAACDRPDDVREQAPEHGPEQAAEPLSDPVRDSARHADSVGWKPSTLVVHRTALDTTRHKTAHTTRDATKHTTKHSTVVNADLDEGADAGTTASTASVTNADAGSPEAADAGTAAGVDAATHAATDAVTGAATDAVADAVTDAPTDGDGYLDDDADATDYGGSFSIEVEDGDVSLLLTLALQHADDTIGITRVIAPDGATVHLTRFEDDSWEAARFDSRIVAEPIVGIGDLAVFLPNSPRLPFASGTWRVDYETDPPDAAFAHVTSSTRRDPHDSADARDAREIDVDGRDDAPLDERSHVVDLYLHVIHADERYRVSGFADELEEAWRPALDRVLAPHALGIGTIEVGVASVRETNRLSDLRNERDTAEACRVIRRAGPSPDDGGTPALHIGFVATLAGDLAWSPAAADDLDTVDRRVDADEAWNDEDGGELTGLSPQPGLPFDLESPRACVFVAEQPWRRGYADGEAPDEETVVELLAANLLHELGHFAGLAHPSEADGETFDLLDDTPRCAAADPGICGAEGGADNLMFLSGDETTLPWTLTENQAWVLRRHPLFRPASIGGP